MPVLSNNITCIAIGEGGVGKRILLCSWAERVYGHAEFCSKNHFQKELTTDNQTYAVDLYNIQFGSPAAEKQHQQLYDTATCALLCFSINNRNSFKAVKYKWYDHLVSNVPLCPVILVGLKADTRKHNKEGLTKLVSYEDAHEFAHSKKIPYVEVSAKTQHGVKGLFKKVLDLSLERIRVKEKMERSYEQFAERHVQQQQQQQRLQQQLMLRVNTAQQNQTGTATEAAAAGTTTPGRPTEKQPTRKTPSFITKLLHRLRLCKSTCCLGRDKEPDPAAMPPFICAAKEQLTGNNLLNTNSGVQNVVLCPTNLSIATLASATGNSNNYGTTAIKAQA